MRRTLLGLAAVGMALPALGGCAGTVLTVGPAKIGPAARTGTAYADPATANRAAAERDAAGRLRRLNLPGGTAPLSSEPSGDHGYLKVPGGLDGDSANATARRWLTIEDPPEAVIAYVREHPPAGSTESGTGSIGNSRTGTSASEIVFQWPASGNVLGNRELEVTVTSLGDGKTGILAQAQTDWIVLRSWSERVPAGVTAVRVRLQRAPERMFAKHLGPVSHALISGRRAVAKAVSLVDSLAIAQPIVIACPLEGVPAGSLTVTYSAGPAGPALAQAKVSLFPGGRDGGAGECDPIGFSIRGRAQKDLIGASFVRRIERLAGLER